MKNLYKKISVLVFGILITGSLNAQTELVIDGGFEAGPGGPAWTESSVTFGTPICDIASCGTGTGTGPRTGAFWSWFGGVAGAIEVASVSQAFVIPSGGTVTLTFWLEQIACDSQQDFMEVQIDGNTIFTTDGSNPICGVLGYSMQTVNLTPYADGNSHTLSFNSTTFSTNGGFTNFFVDDVSVISNTGGGGPLCTDTVTFAGLSVAIPDDDPVGVSDMQSVAGISGTTLGNDVKLVSVCFKVTHTWVGDLYVSLKSPSGTVVALTDRPGFPSTLAGCPGENMDVCVVLGIGNEMENVCVAPPAIAIEGSYTAANGKNLNLINNGGGSPNGSWELLVSDNAQGDTGIITEWKLVFDDGPVANWTPPGPICSNSGSLNLNPLVNGTSGGTWSGNGVTGNTFNPAGLSGAVPVTYTVVDIPTGCTDTEIHDIIVVPGVPAASFSATSISLTTYFTNNSTNGTTYLWDFGDLNTSNAINPSHNYAMTGTYTVTLTATNICGSNVSSQQITVTSCPDIIVDGSVEIGGTWSEFSTNFGSPVCDIANCGNGSGTGPRTGNNWMWFGGIGIFEESSMSQTFTIPVNSSSNLYFWLEQIVCDSPSDFLKIAVDADTVFTTTGGSALCGELGYTLQTVNLDAYDDGLPHTLKFLSRTYGLNGGESNFFVDDVQIIRCTGIGFAENDFDRNISIMPVPATTFIDIRFTDLIAENVTIEILDIVGKNVYSNLIQNVNNQSVQRVDVSIINKGIYLVKISLEGKSTYRKIVIQ